MEVESTLVRSHERYSRLEHSNCLLVLGGLVGFVAFAVCLAVGVASHWALTGFWQFIFIVFGVGGLICWSIVAWQVHLVKREKDDAHRKANAEIRLLNKTSVLVDDAMKNRDHVDLTRNEEKGVTDIKIIRSGVPMPGRNNPQLPKPQIQEQRPAQPAQPGPAIHTQKPLVIPGPYDLIEAIRRFPLSEDNMFLGVDCYRKVTTCNPALELCHGAFNAQTGRGKTILERGLETQLLKMGFEVVHADIKFTLRDEKGNDYKPIAQALMAQGNMQVGGLSLPHLLIREDHIVHFLEWLSGPELQRRLRLYNQGIHNYTVFFLFLEELLYLVGRYKHLGPLLSPLLSVGRSLGVKIFCAAQNFQVQNLKINSGMRENFESAWFLGGDMNSGAALLDMSARDLNLLLVENNIELGKGITIFRNNNVAYKARLMRSGMASNDFVYWMLGHADNFQIPDELLPAFDNGPSTPGGLWVPGGADQDTGALVDEDLQEALEAVRNGARGPRALERALKANGCTYYRARQLWEELTTKGLVENTVEAD